MPTRRGGGTFCPARRWTTVYQGPTFGFIYLWSRSGNVNLRWRRYASGAPWYSDGRVRLSGGRTVLATGGPAIYLRFEVFPPRDVTILAS